MSIALDTPKCTNKHLRYPFLQTVPQLSSKNHTCLTKPSRSMSPTNDILKCSSIQHCAKRFADSLMLILSLQQQIAEFVSNKHVQIKPPFSSIYYVLCTPCQWERCCKKSSSRMVKKKIAINLPERVMVNIIIMIINDL